MNILKIDTSDNLKTSVSLKIHQNIYNLTDERKTPGDQNVLELVQDLLNKHNLEVGDIHEVEVVAGPGSFTGLRVGVSIANAFSFAQKIKVNGKPLGEIENPTY